MRYFLILLAIVLAGLGTLPLSASAQAGQEGATLEPTVEEPAPSSEPALEEPALQLELDSAGLHVVPTPPRPVGGDTLEEMELRVKRARIGLGSASAVLFTGAMFLGFAMGESLSEFCIFEECAPQPNWVNPLAWTGTALFVGGLAGMIASGILLRRRKRDRDSLQEARFGRSHRLQWDLQTSRVVF